jgi:hypothetical protein
LRAGDPAQLGKVTGLGLSGNHAAEEEAELHVVAINHSGQRRLTDHDFNVNAQ